MAADGDKTIPIFTINDFPTELIVRFARDLRPRTVSTLRLVSRRFRDVFSADRYYSSYLCYPDKPNLYRHDLEEIGDQEGKWKLLLEAEKRRLGNWRKGRPARVDTVEIPNDLVSAYDTCEWQGKTGELNDHWMLKECQHQKIVLLNVTKAPILAVVDVSSYTSLARDFAHLLPDQVLINSGTGSSLVFNILNDGKKLSLEYLFTIESNQGENGLSISGNSKVMHTYRSIHVRYTIVSTDAVLKVCDLKRAVKLESIDLRELLSPKCALDLGRTPCLHVRPAGYPYVVVELEKDNDDTERSALVAVVNLEERRLALWSGDINGLDIGECMFDGNYLCIVCCDVARTFQVVSVYDLRLRRAVEDYESCIIFQSEAVDDVTLWDDVTLCNVNPIELLFDYRDIGKYEFVSIDGSQVSQTEINFNKEGSMGQVYYHFGPFFIATRYSNALSTVDMSGNVMFNWADLFREPGGDYFFVKDLDFHSLCKCVLQNIPTEGNVLQICYF